MSNQVDWDSIYDAVETKPHPEPPAPQKGGKQRRGQLSPQEWDAIYGWDKNPPPAPPPRKLSMGERTAQALGQVVDRVTSPSQEPPGGNIADEMTTAAQQIASPPAPDATLADHSDQNPVKPGLRRPSPLSKEAFAALKAQLGAMPPQVRRAQLAREDLPAWMRTAMTEAVRQLDADAKLQETTGVQTPDAPMEARAERLIEGGMRGDVAAGVAGNQALQGGLTVLPGQAKAIDSPLSLEEEAAAKAEGAQLKDSGIAQRGLFAAGQGLKQSVQGGMAMALRALGDEEGAKLYEKEGKRAQVKVDAANELLTIRQRAEEMGVLGVSPAAYLERMGVGAMNSVGQMLPAMGAGAATTVLTKNPMAGARVAMGIMGTQVFGQEFIQGRIEGLAPSHAAGRAAIMGALEYIGERYGLIPAAMNALRGQAAKKTLEELPQWAERAVVALERRGLFSAGVGQVVRGQVGEGIGEQITSAGQYLVDGTKLGLDEDITVAGFLESMRDTAVQTFIATGVMQAGGAAIGRLRTGGRGGAPAPERREPTMGDLPPLPPDFGQRPGITPQIPVQPRTAAAPPAAAASPPANPDAPMDAGALLGTPVDDAAHGAATSPTNDLPEPTDPQKEAGNYKKGHIRLGGLDISIENPQGSVRRGVDPDGKPWENTVQSHYGYIRGTEGKDGDHVDTFIKPGTPPDYDGPVFVIDQRDPRTGKFDEHKVMLGFASPQEAEAAYRANYTPDWRGLGYLSGMDMPMFKDWIKTGNHKAPFSPAFKEGFDDQSDVAAAPAVPGGAGPGVLDNAGRGGGNLGPDAAVPGGVNPAGDVPGAPAPGDGDTGRPGAGSAQPGAGLQDAALSDTPDYEKTYPRPQFDELAAAGRNSMFEGLEDDPVYLTQAVRDTHQQVVGRIQTDLAAANMLLDALRTGTNPETGKPAKPEDIETMRGAARSALRDIEGILAEYGNEFGDRHAEALAAKFAANREDLASQVEQATPEPAAPPPAAPPQAPSAAAEKRRKALESLGGILGQPVRDNVPAAPPGPVEEASSGSVPGGPGTPAGAAPLAPTPEGRPRIRTKGGHAPNDHGVFVPDSTPDMTTLVMPAPKGQAKGVKADISLVELEDGTWAPGSHYNTTGGSMSGGSSSPSVVDTFPTREDALRAAGRSLQRSAFNILEATGSLASERQRQQARAIAKWVEEVTGVKPPTRVQRKEPWKGGAVLNTLVDMMNGALTASADLSVLEALRKADLVHPIKRQLTPAGEAFLRSINTEAKDDTPEQIAAKIEAAIGQRTVDDLRWDEPQETPKAVRRVAGVRSHPATVWGSRMLAEISRQLGGIDPSLLHDLSFKKELGRDRNGRPVARWFNPPVSGIGGLFRDGGIADTNELALWMEEEGYLDPGSYEADYKAADEAARALVTSALNRDEPKTRAEQQAEDQADEDAERQAWEAMTPQEREQWLADNHPELLYPALDEEAAAEAEAERRAIMEEAGITPAELDALDDDDVAWDAPAPPQSLADQMRALGFSEQEIADELAKEAAQEQEAARRDAEAGQDGPGGQGAPVAPGAVAPRDGRQEAVRRLEDLASRVVNGRERAPDVLRDECGLFMPCGAMKLGAPTPAKDFYTGPLWNTYRKALGAQSPPRLFILSAKHGFVRPDQVIEPYDQLMTAERADELVASIASGELPVGLLAAMPRDIQIVGGEHYRRVMRAAVAKAIEDGAIPEDASVREFIGGTGEMNRAIKQYVAGLPADGDQAAAAPPAPRPPDGGRTVEEIERAIRILHLRARHEAEQRLKPQTPKSYVGPDHWARHSKEAKALLDAYTAEQLKSRKGQLAKLQRSLQWAKDREARESGMDVARARFLDAVDRSIAALTEEQVRLIGANLRLSPKNSVERMRTLFMIQPVERLADAYRKAHIDLTRPWQRHGDVNAPAPGARSILDEPITAGAFDSRLGLQIGTATRRQLITAVLGKMNAVRLDGEVLSYDGEVAGSRSSVRLDTPEERDFAQQLLDAARPSAVGRDWWLDDEQQGEADPLLRPYDEAELRRRAEDEQARLEADARAERERLAREAAERAERENRARADADRDNFTLTAPGADDLFGSISAYDPPAAPPAATPAPADDQQQGARQRIRDYWLNTAYPALRDYGRAFQLIGADRLESNRIKPEGMTAAQWLQQWQTQESKWDGGRKVQDTGIQALSQKDLWPTDDGLGEQLRKSLLAAVRALKNAPGIQGDWIERAVEGRKPFPEDDAQPAIPEGFRQVARYLKDGVEVDGYAPVGKLQRVRELASGQPGYVESFYGPGPAFEGAIVRFEVGGSRMLRWSELEAAGPRFASGDPVTWQPRTPDGEPDGPPLRTKVTAVKSLNVGGGAMQTTYTLDDPRFAPGTVQAFALDGELSGPEDSVAPPAPAKKGPKVSPADRARMEADSRLRGMIQEATDAGATLLAQRLAAQRVRGPLVSSGLTPAEVRLIDERLKRLLQRARRDPQDRFDDIGPGRRPRVDRLNKAEAEYEAKFERLRAYYTPGNIVQGYAGFDEVLEFQPATEAGGWAVKVVEVVKEGDRWVRKPGETPRWHSTWPDAREFAAGPLGRSENAPTPEREAEARTKRLTALGRMSDIFGPPKAEEPGPEYGDKPAPPALTREQEQALLPVLAELLDAAVIEGKRTFREAAAKALADVAEFIGPQAAESLTLKHLQGAYISMSARYTDGSVDDLMTVAQVKSKADLTEAPDAPVRTPPTPQPDRPAGQDAPVEAPAGDGRARPPAGNGQAGGRAARPGQRSDGGAGVPGSGTPAAGTPGDRPRAGGQPRVGRDGARSADDQRGDFAGDQGKASDPISDGAVEDAARSTAADVLKRRQLQRQAEALPVKLNDEENIRASLPMLLPEQQQDVIDAEARLTQPTGYGMLFTNGTGTGKTYTGLGVAKRFAKQGKDAILVVVPDRNILEGWLRSGPDLGLKVTALENTKDHGTGVVVTTYANLRDNNALLKRRWDLVIADEVHEMGQSQEGTITESGLRIRALTMHPESAETRTQMAHPELYAEIVALTIEQAGHLEKQNHAAAAEIDKVLLPKVRRFAELKVQQESLIEQGQGAGRTRLLMLSATPFAWEQSTVIAQGYLFDWNEGFVPGRGYNAPSAYQNFMIQHFGWRMRYGKLTKPEWSVNSSIMQRQFNTWLKNQGVLRGRMLLSDFDYDRKFIAANSAIGQRIDRGLQWFWEADPSEALPFLTEGAREEYEKDPKSGLDKLRAGIHKASRKLRSEFDYLTRMRMLEAIKAEAAVPYIRAQLELGRKVVLFHDLIQGQRLDPFNVKFNPQEDAWAYAAMEAWRKEFDDLVTYPWDTLKSPIQTMMEHFADRARVLNGRISDKEKVAAVDWFNDDDTGPALLVVQADKDKGWSGHDTTGKHQRVLINLGLPVRPTRSIQQEGRIYRVGQASNAMFRYFNTQTSWERAAFAEKIAERAEAAENLGLGEMARGLRDAYIEAFEDTGDWPPGFEGEGTGGKARDREMAQILSDWDRAMSMYWAQRKKNQQTKSEEGHEYYPTPEPIGLKMVQWLDLRPGELAIEPSAGHGAIARWLPDTVHRLAVEPSTVLASRLAMVFDGDIRETRFEDLPAANKAWGIAMNPPFERGGKLAFEHLAKAYNQHLFEGGRIVALLPEGPAADARLEKFLRGTQDVPIKALGTARIADGEAELFYDDRIELRNGRVGHVREVHDTHVMAKMQDTGRIEPVLGSAIDKLEESGPRKKSEPIAPGAHVVATIRLPGVAFARAGTGVRTRIVVIDKLGKDQTAPAPVEYDFSGTQDIAELFGEVENLGVPERTKPRAEEGAEEGVDGAAPPADQARQEREKKKAAKAEARTSGEELATKHGLEVIGHTTRQGKLILGVILRHVDAQQVKAALPESFVFNKDGGTFVALHRLQMVLDAFPVPPVAAQERAVYAVNEPEANYDLFEQPLPDPRGGNPPRAGRAPRRNVPAPNAVSVREDPFFPGIYHVTSQLVEVRRHDLPVARVTNWNEAAAALSALTRYAVEHFDALVTDKNGRPLAIIGAFKGAPSQTSVYPGVVLMEAMRIKDAHSVWAVHNHPSGRSELSRADENLSQAMARSFEPSTVRWRGLAAVADDDGITRFMAVTPEGGTYSGVVTPSATTTTTVPVVERTIESRQTGLSVIGSPAEAKDKALVLHAADSRPGLLFMNYQSKPTAWVPLAPAVAGRLRQDDRYDRLINSAAEAAASTVLVMNPGGAYDERTLENIKAALALADVRLLDVIDPVSMSSAAERGTEPGGGLPVMSGQPATKRRSKYAPGVAPDKLGAAVAEATRHWSREPGMPVVAVARTAAELPPDIQDYLRRMRALNSTRGLLMPDGRVFLVADMIGSIDEGLRVLWHEVYGHFGLRAFLGDRYTQMMLALRAANPALATEAAAWHAQWGAAQVQARVGLGMSRQDAEQAVQALAVEEALADRAAGAPAPKAWRYVMASLQRALRQRFGEFGKAIADWLESLTEAETFDLLMSARRAVAATPHVDRGELPALSQQPPPAAAPPSLRPISLKLPRATMETPFSAFDLVNYAIEKPVQLVATPVDALIKKVVAPGAVHAGRMADAFLGGHMGDYWEYIKAGLVDRYGVSDGFSEAKTAMRTAIRVNARKTRETVDKLRALTMEQSRVAYLWMNTNPENPGAEPAMRAAAALFDALPEGQRAVLASLKQDIEHLSDEAVRLGLISAESRERNRFAYMHRSYERHTADERLANEVKSRSIRILGDTLKGRGMRDNASMAQIGTADWWQRKTNSGAHDPSLKGQKFHRLELRDKPRDDDTPQLFEDENGQPLGRIRQIVYWPEDVPIPRHLLGWRNDGLWEARFFDQKDKVGMWRDFTLAERTKMGEIQEVKFATVATMMQMTRDIETARFLDWVARNESVADESRLPAGAKQADASYFLARSYLKNEWVQVPSTKIKGTNVTAFGNLAGRWVPGPVWNELRQIGQFTDQGQLSRLWQSMLKLWKISKTALSPVTHMNNVMANWLFADMHDIQGRHLYLALRAMATARSDPEMKKLVEDFEDNGGDAGMFNEVEIREELYKPLLEELRREIERDAGGQSLITAAQVMDLLRHREYRQALAAAKDAPVGRAAAWVPRKLIKLYGAEDVVFRLAAFVKAREDGISDHDAGKFARDSFLNYEISAPWVNAMRRTVWPFFSFTYRAVPMMLKTAVDKPHKLMKYGLVAGSLNTLAYMMLGDDGDEERERAWLADEKAGRIWGFLTPKLVRMPWNDANGNPVFLDVRRWVALGDIVDTGTGNAAVPIPPPLIPGGPAVLFFEFMLNTAGFTGRDITLRTDELGEKLGASAEHLWKGLMPNFPGLPGTYSTENLLNAWRGRIEPGPLGQEKASLAQAFFSAIGVKLGSYAPETQEYLFMQGINAELREIEAQLRRTIIGLERSGLSEDDRWEAEQDAIDKAMRKIDRRWQEVERRRARAEGYELEEQ